MGHVLNGVFRAEHSSFYHHYYLYRTKFKGCIKDIEQNKLNLSICRPTFIIKSFDLSFKYTDQEIPKPRSKMSVVYTEKNTNTHIGKLLRRK